MDLYTDEEERIDEFLEFFLVFLRKAKGIDTKDHDLSYLSLDELKELVRQFHEMYPPSSETDIARAVVGTMDTCELKISSIDMKEEQFDAQKVYYVMLGIFRQTEVGTMNLWAMRSANKSRNFLQWRIIETTLPFLRSKSGLMQARGQENGRLFWNWREV